MKNIEVKIKKLNEEAVIPKYAHDGDVCMDMTAISMSYDVEKDMYIYHTGLAFESEKNIGQFLFLRSSNCKTEAYLCNGVGIADSAIYRGEIQFRFKNRTSTKDILEKEMRGKIAHSLSDKLDRGEEVNIGDVIGLNYPIEFTEEDIIKKAIEMAPYNVGDRVGQMVFIEYPTVNLIEVEELSDTDRGAGGFGSTGK